MTDSVLCNLGGSLSSIAIDRDKHIAAAMNTKPLRLPDVLDQALYEAESIDSVADDLCRLFNLMTRNIHNGGYDYVLDTVNLTDTDLSGDLSINIFCRINGYHTGGVFYPSDSFIVIDNQVYQLEDNDTVDSCGILETTLGWWLSPVHKDADPRLLDPINDRLSAFYSSSPLHELEEVLDSGYWYDRNSGTTYHNPRTQRPTPTAHYIPDAYWVENKKEYRCRIVGIPYVCSLVPVEPHYGG